MDDSQAAVLTARARASGDREEPQPAPAAAGSKPGLWNVSFLLLWQGQLVSALGDAVYGIALGFWVLERTGSTALMGTLMAVSTLPRVVLAPLAGVWVDRSDRRRLLILMDVIRGVFITAVAIAAYSGLARVWMVFAAGVVIGVCGAFFGPAVGSVLPDVVDRNRLVQANSAFNLIYTVSGVVGSSGGGFLFQMLGAPLMFLLNGLSYLASSLTLLFTRIPRIVRQHASPHFWADLKVGVLFAWRFTGLRFLMLVAAFLNFFATIGIVLFLPLFQRTAGLGAGKYGLLMGIFSAGLFLGFLFSSLVRIPAGARYRVFMICGFGCMGLMAGIPLVMNYPVMLGLAFAAGVMNAILNSFISALVGLAVPQDLRGKVFALMGALSQGLTPIAMALAGVLAEFMPIRPLMAGSFAITVVMFIPLAFIPSFRDFIRFDPERQDIRSLIAGPPAAAPAGPQPGA
jgi:MFS family permease